jgi:hypothetical protein
MGGDPTTTSSPQTIPIHPPSSACAIQQRYQSNGRENTLSIVFRSGLDDRGVLATVDPMLLGRNMGTVQRKVY